MNPVGPVGPVGPVNPVKPVGPVGPVGPVIPVVPVTPGTAKGVLIKELNSLPAELNIEIEVSAGSVATNKPNTCTEIKGFINPVFLALL